MEQNTWLPIQRMRNQGCQFDNLDDLPLKYADISGDIDFPEEDNHAASFLAYYHLNEIETVKNQEHDSSILKEKSFKCVHCLKSFRYRTSLFQHVCEGSLQKGFRCKECGKTLARKSSLIGHLRIHTGEKPFKWVGKKLCLPANSQKICFEPSFLSCAQPKIRLIYSTIKKTEFLNKENKSSESVYAKILDHLQNFANKAEPIHGRRFATQEDIANAVCQQVTRFTHGAANAEADGIQRLPHRWQRVVTVAEDYIEGL
ncbi:zinc finger protein 624 [Trichonephila clavipes]|nr:zinc finger protein 624 [Trichonephila clavipes]